MLVETQRPAWTSVVNAKCDLISSCVISLGTRVLAEGTCNGFMSSGGVVMGMLCHQGLQRSVQDNRLSLRQIIFK